MPMMKRLNILAFVWVCFSVIFSQHVFAGDDVLSNNPKELESNAKYNYFLGQYYYTQGKITSAEQYFQRSRDLLNRRTDVLAHRANVALTPTGVSGGGAATGEYLVGEGDVLYVSVWQNDDLNQEVVVRPDGKLSFPLIGEMQASGRTISDISQELTQRLTEYIKLPQVSVTIHKFGGSKVIILGEVNRPGVYAVSGNRTILEAIALAGGLTNDAVSNSVVLVRGGLHDPKPQRLNLSKAMMGRAKEANVSLQSEDIIYVPKTFIANVSYALLQIIQPAAQGVLAAQTMHTWNGASAK